MDEYERKVKRDEYTLQSAVKNRFVLKVLALRNKQRSVWGMFGQAICHLENLPTEKQLRRTVLKSQEIRYKVYSLISCSSQTMQCPNGMVKQN